MKKLVTVFRKPLVPIYTAFPALGLQFCAALYAEIFEAQIKNSVEPGSTISADKAQWEMVQNSLLSGVLVGQSRALSQMRAQLFVGFLGRDSKLRYDMVFHLYFLSLNDSYLDKNKDLAAAALYSVLCDIYFSLSEDDPISRSSGSLIINVSEYVLCGLLPSYLTAYMRPFDASDIDNSSRSARFSSNRSYRTLSINIDFAIPRY